MIVRGLCSKCQVSVRLYKFFSADFLLISMPAFESPIRYYQHLLAASEDAWMLLKVRRLNEEISAIHCHLHPIKQQHSFEIAGLVRG